jgi:hypothetical protein
MINIKNESSLYFDNVPKIQSTDSYFETEIEDKNAEGVYKISTKYTVEQDTQIERLVHALSIDEISEVYILTNKNSKLKLITKSVISSYEFLHLELLTKTGSYVYIYNHKPFTAQLTHNSGTFIIEIIHDAPFLHTTWDYANGQRESTANPVFSKGTKFEASFIIQKSKHRLISFLPSFYPNKIKACFILTDHCDFDTVEKLDLFLNGNNNDGWLNKSLKITKGVFRYAPTDNEVRKSDDLENSEYKKLINKLQQDGSEIAPHALKHSGQIDKEMFLSGLKYLAAEYDCKTWIDHGHYIKYCYSQGGQLNPEYKTLDTLINLNYTSLWSYHDVALDPTLSLNYFEPKKFSKLNGLGLILKHLLKFNLLYSAHYLRSFVHKTQEKSLLTDFLNYFFACSKIILIKRKINLKLIKEFIVQLSKFKQFRSNVNLPFTLKEVNKYLPPIFTANHQTINNWKNELLFFNTIETTHNKDIYTRKQLDKLISSRGLHIGHTYILNSLPYLNGIFDIKKNKLKLSKEWIEFTNYLSEKIKANEIWNPNMSEFVERIKSILDVEYYLTEDGLKAINNSDKNINELKFFQSNESELIFNIPANTEIKINKQV